MFALGVVGENFDIARLVQAIHAVLKHHRLLIHDQNVDAVGIFVVQIFPVGSAEGALLVELEFSKLSFLLDFTHCSLRHAADMCPVRVG